MSNLSVTVLSDSKGTLRAAGLPEGCRESYEVLLPNSTQAGDYFAMYEDTYSSGLCPDVIFAFGYLPDRHTADQVHAYACDTVVDILDADTKSLLPNFTIASAEPIESSRQTLVPRYKPYSDFERFLPVINDTKASDRIWAAVLANGDVTTADSSGSRARRWTQ